MSYSEILSWTLVVLLAASSAELLCAGASQSLQPDPRPFQSLPHSRGEQPPPKKLVTELLRTSLASGLDEKQEQRSSEIIPLANLPKIALQGVLAGAEGAGLAFVSCDGQLHSVSQGDNIPGTQITLTRVEPDRVDLKLGEENLVLELGAVTEPQAPAQQHSKEKLAPLGRKEFQEYLDNPDFLRTFKTTPSIEEGLMKGVILTFNAPNHPFARLGLQNGDLIKSINQTSLDRAGVLSELLPMLRNSQTLVLEIERSAQAQTLRIEMEE